MRLLIVSHDTVGTRMAGTGIRYWELARALARDAQVTLAAPGSIDLAPDDFAATGYAPGSAAALLDLAREAELVLANGHVLALCPELAEVRVPLILDLYDPVPLENLDLFRAERPERRAEQAARDAALLRTQLAVGDAFLCATERQRDLYIGSLLALGRVTPATVDRDPLLHGLIDVVSFGLPDEPPVPSAPALRGVIPGVDGESELLLWTGGLWDWMDPLTLIRAVPQVLERHPRACVVFLAGPHPGGAMPMRMPDQARDLAHELGLLGRSVHFYAAWVPYAQRAGFLLEADLLVSLGRPGLESAYAAVRSRFLDHLWAGRASLVSGGDAAAQLVASGSLGRVVPPGDVPATAAAIGELLADRAAREACAARARARAADFSWRRVAEPIRRLIAEPPQRMAMAAPVPLDRPATQATLSQQGSSMDDTTRNETISRLDRLWQLQPQPLSSGVPGVGKAKELANSLTRWYVQAIVDQQNSVNAAVVQALQALAASDDRRHSELSLHIHSLTNHLNQTRQVIAQTQRRLEQTASRVEELARHLADVDDAETALAAAVAELRALAAELPAGEGEG